MNEVFPCGAGKDLNQILGMSDDALTEHAYLIDRGVRPMAFLTSIKADMVLMQRVYTRLEITSYGFDKVIPFVIERNDGTAVCGFAARKWVVDTFEWIDKAPEPYRDRIRGLLLGYSVQEIATFDEYQSVLKRT